MVWFGLEFNVFPFFFFFLLLVVGVLFGTDGSGFCRIWDTQTQIVVLSLVGV